MRYRLVISYFKYHSATLASANSVFIVLNVYLYSRHYYINLYSFSRLSANHFWAQD